MTLTWKRTLAEWACFSKAVTSGEKERKRTYPTCLSADKLLSFHHVTCSSVLFWHVRGPTRNEGDTIWRQPLAMLFKAIAICVETATVSDIGFTNARISRAMRSIGGIYWMQVLTCWWRRYNSIVFAVQLVRKCPTSVSSFTHVSLSIVFSLSAHRSWSSFIINGCIKLIRRRYSTTICKSKHRHTSE